MSRLYGDLALLWPLVSPPESYAPEARTLRRALERRLRFRARHHPTLLELGAGGGHLLSHLRDAFAAEAVDLSPAMLENFAALNPGVPCHIGDMRRVRLRRRFDVVLIHDAISYMLSEADLLAALRTAAAHLRPGGLLALLPDYTRETFRDHETAHDCHRRGDLEVVTLSHVHDADPRDTAFELTMLYMICEAGMLRIEEDRHTCGLFLLETWLRLLRRAGFDAELFGTSHSPTPWFICRLV